MTIQLRIPRTLCEAIRSDLARPHAFAAERVGFARAAFGTVGEGSLLLLKSYWAVPDDEYIEDEGVGARIDSRAIRFAMQDVLSAGGRHGLFHVHMHPYRGPTGLSRTDKAELPKLVNSFRNVAPQATHGFMILTPDHGLAFALPPKAEHLFPVTKITIVGYPTEILL